MLVNLKDISQNLAELKKAAGNKKFCSVVKADAYRHGAAAVAREIQSESDMFAVATANEAIYLRLSGIKKDILLLSPAGDATEAERLLAYGIVLTISSYAAASTINGAARNRGEKARVHIKINTGMNRYGFSSYDAFSGRLSEFIKREENIFVEGIYSHFYNQSDRASCERQFALFVGAAYSMEEKLKKRLIKHVAATGAVASGGDRYSLDMVRCGLGLYGYSPVKSDIPLKAAASCFAPVAESRVYLFGGTGYGEDYKGEEKEFSTLRFGYADGLPFVDGLCMDAVVLPKKCCGYVKIFSDAQQAADKYGVSVYKVLCSLGERIEKRYVYV